MKSGDTSISTDLHTCNENRHRDKAGLEFLIPILKLWVVTSVSPLISRFKEIHLEGKKVTKTFTFCKTQNQIMSALRERQDKKAPQRRRLSSAITTVPHVQPRSKGSNLGCVTRVTDRDPPSLRDGLGQLESRVLPRQHRHGLSERRCRSYRQTNILWDTSTMKINQNEDLLCLMRRSVFSSVTPGAGLGPTAPQPRSHRRRPLPRSHQEPGPAVAPFLLFSLIQLRFASGRGCPGCRESTAELSRV